MDPKNSMYIWHCPNEKCRRLGTVLFKTFDPFLPGGIIKCPCCGNLYSFESVMNYNIKNLKKYIDSYEDPLKMEKLLT